jgi:hypothetical protein
MIIVRSLRSASVDQLNELSISDTLLKVALNTIKQTDLSIYSYTMEQSTRILHTSSNIYIYIYWNTVKGRQTASTHRHVQRTAHTCCSLHTVITYCCMCGQE